MHWVLYGEQKAPRPGGGEGKGTGTLGMWDGKEESKLKTLRTQLSVPWVSTSVAGVKGRQQGDWL